MTGQRTMESDPADETAPSAAAQFELEHFLPHHLNVVSSLVSQAVSRIYARRYRIGIPEWRVLVTLGQHNMMTGKAIGAKTHMHKTKVSRAVAVLEKRKLLTRRINRSDMREAFLSLTAPGRQMYDELAPRAVEFSRQLTDILTPGDQDAFLRALKQITDRCAQLVAEGAETENPTEDA
jgi:DNA-binding MarR family transcriptional regulator